MAQKQFKIGLSNTDKQNMAQDVYERVLALTFNEYDTTTEYEVGDFVVYNDQLYKCISATSGAWDSSKWQLATLNDLVDDIENAVAFVNDKANVDGNYPTMTVGAADNLTPYDEESGVEQEQPFLLQGTGCGNGEQQVDTGALGLLKEKQGHTVVVNQKLTALSNTTYTDGGVTITYSNGYHVHIEGTASGNAFGVGSINFNAIANHKYLVLFDRKGTVSPNDGFQLYFQAGSFSKTYYLGLEIVECLSSSSAIIQGVVYEGAEINFDYDLHIIDLTQWFGSNDNIPAHLLAHPEDFFRYYQGSLAYNEGTLVNANGRYLKAIGRNQWDEEWELGGIEPDGSLYPDQDRIRSKNYIRVIPNTTYYSKTPRTTRIVFYDKDKNFISYTAGTNETFKTPSNCLYAKFVVYNGTTYNHDITISIYYDGESGYDQYYPYEELANIDTGTEVLRSAGSVKDSKAPDGTITRRIGVVDLSTLTWEYVEVSGYNSFFKAVLSSAKVPANQNTAPNLTCSKYVGDIAFNSAIYETNDKVITINPADNTLCIVDSSLQSTDTPSGICCYELAEPTTEQGTTFSENIAIDDFGSMDFGGTNGVPQGASIFYAVDYKAFIDSLYNTLDGDATDIVKESELDTKLATLGYVKLTSVSGYDATKTQVLKNVEGTLTWVTEE